MGATKETEGSKVTTKQIILPEDRVEKLTETDLEKIKPNRGRTATPSRYTEQVQEAIAEPTTAFKIVLYPGYDLRPVQVLSELRKAAKQLDVKLQTWDRSKDTEAPFIAYRIRLPKDNEPMTGQLSIVPEAEVGALFKAAGE